MTDYQVKRNYRGAVWVAPEGAPPIDGEWKTSKDQKRYFKASSEGATTYARSSSAGEHLKGGGSGLADWKSAMAVVGTVLSAGTPRLGSIYSELVTLVNEYDGDPYYKGDDGGSKSGKARLLSAVEDAAKLAGSESASALGTEFHKLAEIVNRGEEPRIVRDALVGHLNHYQHMVKPIRFLFQEILIIHDQLQRAGSIDYLMELPAGTLGPEGDPLEEPWIVAGDLKTGKWDAKYPAGLSAQLAAYALGYRYKQETNERFLLHPKARRDWAVLVHFPLTTDDPTVQFYWIDLAKGFHAAQLNNRLDEMTKFFQSKAGKPIPFTLNYAA